MKCPECEKLGRSFPGAYIIARTPIGYSEYDFYNFRGQFVKWHEDVGLKKLPYTEFYMCHHGDCHIYHKTIIINAYDGIGNKCESG